MTLGELMIAAWIPIRWLVHIPIQIAIPRIKPHRILGDPAGGGWVVVAGAVELQIEFVVELAAEPSRRPATHVLAHLYAAFPDANCPIAAFQHSMRIFFV